MLGHIALYRLAAVPLAYRGFLFEKLRKGKNSLKPAQDFKPGNKIDWDICEASYKWRIVTVVIEILIYRQKKPYYFI